MGTHFLYCDTGKHGDSPDVVIQAWGLTSHGDTGKHGDSPDMVIQIDILHGARLKVGELSQGAELQVVQLKRVSFLSVKQRTWRP